MQRLQQQRELQQKLQDQQTRRQQLDHCLRLKMKRLAREQQDELQLDMNILQQLLKQEADERQEAAQRKVRTPESALMISPAAANIYCKKSCIQTPATRASKL